LKTILITIALTFIFTEPAMCSDWRYFATGKDGTKWYYDRDSIYYPRMKKLIGFIVTKDKSEINFWIKGTNLYKITMDCDIRYYSLYDEEGNSISKQRNSPSQSQGNAYTPTDYSAKAGPYSIKPNSLWDVLLNTVCK
jgi:hypothetical protein